MSCFQSLSGRIDFNELLTRFLGDRIARNTAVLHIQINCLTDIVQCFVSIIALADAPRQCGDAGDISTVWFLF